jgi:hypothetical protein
MGGWGQSYVDGAGASIHGRNRGEALADFCAEIHEPKKDKPIFESPSFFESFHLFPSKTV